MTIRRQHRPTLTIARNLTEDAETIQRAYDLLANELTRIEAWPTTTLGDGTPRSTNTATQPEREAIRIDTLLNGDTDDTGNQRASIWLLNQLVKYVRDAHRDLMDEVHKTIRLFDAAIVERKRCTPPEHITEGKHLPLYGPDGELLPPEIRGWHDPTCHNYSRSTKGGLCNLCRQRLDQWRDRNHLRELDDERPIDHDSGHYIGHNGVAHARPTEITT